jgi:hypothetical protein
MIRYYVDEAAQKIYAFFLLFETCAVMYNLVRKVTAEELIKDNFQITVFCTTLFMYYAWKSYFISQQEDIYFAEAKDIKCETRIILYFKALHKFTAEAKNNQDNSLILSSIRKQH